MIIYTCRLTGNEICSDASKIHDEGGLLRVECKNIVVDNRISDALIGGNASAEEASEGTEDEAQTVIDVVHNHRLYKVEGGMAKKDYMANIKSYSKRLAAHFKEVGEPYEGWQAEFQDACKTILKGFKDFDIYTGESMDFEAAYGHLNYLEDGITPFLVFYKAGLKAEKV